MPHVIVDVPGKVYAYSEGALLVIVRGPDVSPFGSAYESVRAELVGRCQTLGYRGPQAGSFDVPAWAVNAEVSVYKVWAECPPFEHECAEVAHVAI